MFQTITEGITALTQVATVGCLIYGILEGKKKLNSVVTSVEGVHAATTAVAERVEQVHAATNGLTERLQVASKELGIAIGTAQEKDRLTVPPGDHLTRE